jgi:hypothetical protein
MSVDSNLFTLATNETRVLNARRIREHKKTKDSGDSYKQRVSSRYLDNLASTSHFRNEIESIVMMGGFQDGFRIPNHTPSVLPNEASIYSAFGSAIPSAAPSAILSPLKMSHSKRSLGHLKSKSSSYLTAKQTQFSRHIEELSRDWLPGPVLMRQGRILGPLKGSNGVLLKDAKAKHIQAQTNALRANMKEMGMVSKRNAALRRKAINDCREEGRDYVIKSLINFAIDTPTVSSQKQVLSDILRDAKVDLKYRSLDSDELDHGPPSTLPSFSDALSQSYSLQSSRSPTKMHPRMEKVCAVLQCPEVVKLELKFIKHSITDDAAALTLGGPLNKQAYLTASGLESLCRHIHACEVLFKLFNLCIARNVYPECSIESFVESISEFVATLKLPYITKKVNESLYEWLQRLIKVIFRKIDTIISVWIEARAAAGDKFGLVFFREILNDVIRFIPKQLPECVPLASTQGKSKVESKTLGNSIVVTEIALFAPSTNASGPLSQASAQRTKSSPPKVDSSSAKSSPSGSPVDSKVSIHSQGTGNCAPPPPHRAKRPSRIVRLEESNKVEETVEVQKSLHELIIERIPNVDTPYTTADLIPFLNKRVRLFPAPNRLDDIMGTADPEAVSAKKADKNEESESDPYDLRRLGSDSLREPSDTSAQSELDEYYDVEDDGDPGSVSSDEGME